MELKNSTVLVTGGTSGFGLEFAKQLTALGSTVIITGRDQTKLDQTKKLLPQIHTFQSDVSDPEAVKAIFDKVSKQFPDLNILINNAGIMRQIDLHDSKELTDLTREIEINLMGPIRMIQQFLPFLKTKKAAAIMNVTSGLAMIPLPIAPIYGASKAGLRSYTQSLRVQLQGSNITIIELVAPAAKTPLIKYDGQVSDSMLMAPDKLVAEAIRGLQNNKPEVYPGMAKMIRVMSRLAPGFLLKQLSKSVGKK